MEALGLAHPSYKLGTLDKSSPTFVRGFRHKSSPTFVILDKIKREARLWMLAGAKCLGDFIPEEYFCIFYPTVLSCMLLLN
jgi:hypothetical protein